MKMNAYYTSFVAVGDSFTEGMSDGLPDGSYRGWADLLAARLATVPQPSAGGTPTSLLPQPSAGGTPTSLLPQPSAGGTPTSLLPQPSAGGTPTSLLPQPSAGGTPTSLRSPGFRYANLAVRGKLIGQIVDEQCGPAAAMGADLVTLVGGLNDVLRPKCDVDRVCAQLAEAAGRLAEGGGQLVLMRSPGREGPVMERFRPRMEQLFAQIDALAARHGAVVVDLYASRALADPRLWADDRLHLNAEGHRRVAEAVWQALGLAAESDWDAPLPASVPPGWGARRTADLRFAREHLVPWIGRRLTGRSSGDGRTGAQFSAELGKGFWVSPADHTAPGPVTDWQRVGT